MLRLFKELYLTAFTIFFRVGGADWTPGINAGKGIAGIALIEALLLLGIASWIEMLAGTRYRIARWEAVITYFAICVGNHYSLVTCGHGTAFERRFSSLKSSRKILLIAASVAIMLVAVVVFVCSAQAHRRFLGIHD
jgi:hypothetical protein